MRLKITSLLLTGFGISLLIWIFSHTKSSFLQEGDEFSTDRSLFIYNGVPKAGGINFMDIFFNLAKSNHLNALYVNTSSKNRMMAPLDEFWFVNNITTWTERMPAIYHGQFPFINFIRYGKQQPIFINILSPPLERLISYYYSLSDSDAIRSCLHIRPQKKVGRSFDDCVRKRRNQCNDNKLWLQVPYFCGSIPQCWEPGNEWALSTAKLNLVNYYYLVGVTEKLADFYKMLEMLFPRYFIGASLTYSKEFKMHDRQVKTKVPIKREINEWFKKSKIWQMENEFYIFAKTIFLTKLEQFGVSMKQQIQKQNIIYQKVLPSRRKKKRRK